MCVCVIHVCTRMCGRVCVHVRMSVPLSLHGLYAMILHSAQIAHVFSYVCVESAVQCTFWLTMCS